jgi:hypothetical protein
MTERNNNNNEATIADIDVAFFKVLVLVHVVVVIRVAAIKAIDDRKYSL